jgi:hypothetical protein
MESVGEVFEPVELKYCERCGGLWLRLHGDEEVYCPECTPKMAELPPRRRGRVLSSFEDGVIFVHDVERSIGKLDWLSQQLIAKIIFQGFAHDETARLLGCCRKTVTRRLPDALDRLSKIFLAVGILKPLPEPKNGAPEACQEAEEDEMTVIM